MVTARVATIQFLTKIGKERIKFSLFLGKNLKIVLLDVEIGYRAMNYVIQSDICALLLKE